MTLGGFGSVPGAMYAGLIIGLIQALSALVVVSVLVLLLRRPLLRLRRMPTPAALASMPTMESPMRPASTAAREY